MGAMTKGIIFCSGYVARHTASRYANLPFQPCCLLYCFFIIRRTYSQTNKPEAKVSVFVYSESRISDSFQPLPWFSCSLDFFSKLKCGEGGGDFVLLLNCLTSTFECIFALKGQCHKIFCSWFFSSISFPPAPEFPIWTVSNFFENSRRYSQIKDDHRCRCWHRWQMKKSFNQKNCNNFVGTPLDSRGYTYIHFCLQVHFKVSAAWYYSHRRQILPPVLLVSLTPVANLPPGCRWYRWQFATGVVDTGGKFAAGIIDTGGKFATGINNTSKTGGKICRRCCWCRR